MRLFTIEFNKHKYVGHGETKRTRTGYEEHVYVIEDGYDQIAEGRAKWQNRSWQNFEYAKALEDAVIKWFGRQAADKIYKAVDDSRNCQEAMDKFIRMFNKNESCNTRKNRKLKENKWKYELKNGRALRDAIEDGDLEGVCAMLQTCYQELRDKGFIDDYDCDEYVEEIDCLDLDDDYAEDEVDYALDNFYDLCDNLNVWVTL